MRYYMSTFIIWGGNGFTLFPMSHFPTLFQWGVVFIYLLVQSALIFKTFSLQLLIAQWQCTGLPVRIWCNCRIVSRTILIRNWIVRATSIQSYEKLCKGFVIWKFPMLHLLNEREMLAKPTYVGLYTWYWEHSALMKMKNH